MAMPHKQKLMITLCISVGTSVGGMFALKPFMTSPSNSDINGIEQPLMIEPTTAKMRMVISHLDALCVINVKYEHAFVYGDERLCVWNLFCVALSWWSSCLMYVMSVLNLLISCSTCVNTDLNSLAIDSKLSLNTSVMLLLLLLVSMWKFKELSSVLDKRRE